MRDFDIPYPLHFVQQEENMNAKLALLRQCDAVLACKGVTGHTRTFWLALRDAAQPSLGSVFG